VPSDRGTATTWESPAKTGVDVSPVQAALRILDDELLGLTSWLAAQDNPVAACALFLRFGTMITATPALRVHQRT
jgi:hypothetical protein